MPKDVPILRLARFAMGTRFEAVLHGADEVALRSAGEAALDEIAYWSDRLNLFRKDSFLSFLNAMAFDRPVRMDAELYDLLELCQKVHQESGGAFDVTVGPLMARLGFHHGAPGSPESEPGERILEGVGFGHLELNRDDLSLRFKKPGMRLDFGAVAKGFALDRAGEILKEAGISSALLHGGTSTVLALGSSPGGGRWRVGVRDPERAGALLKVVEIENRALSISAPHGRTLEKEDKVLGHVLDPRTGVPAAAAALAAVTGSSAALADAWSTAFLAAGPERFEELVEKAPGMTALLCRPDRRGRVIEIRGPLKALFRQPGSSPDDLENDDDERS